MKSRIVFGVEVLLVLYVVFADGNFYFFSLPFIIIQMVSLLLIFWAFVARKVYKKKVMIHKGKEYFLLKEGPYEFLRHPIYSGFLLLCSAYAQEYIVLSRAAAFLVFILVMMYAIREDDRVMEKYFGQEYSDYKKTSKKIVPFVY